MSVCKPDLQKETETAPTKWSLKKYTFSEPKKVCSAKTWLFSNCTHYFGIWHHIEQTEVNFLEIPTVVFWGRLSDTTTSVSKGLVSMVKSRSPASAKEYIAFFKYNIPVSQFFCAYHSLCFTSRTSDKIWVEPIYCNWFYACIRVWRGGCTCAAATKWCHNEFYNLDTWKKHYFA